MAMHGPIPAGAVCRHKCDVPLCVNPDHIEIGTQADNVRDMLKRQRSHHHTDPSVGVRAAKRANETMRLNPSLRPLGERNGMHGVGMPGERNGNAKLTEAKAEEIRALAGTLSQRAIARMYGVHQGVVWRIIKGQRWQARTAAALRAIAMEMSDAR